MTSLHLRSTAFVCALFSGYLALFMIIPALLDMARGNSEWQVFAASALLVGGLAASVGLATYSRSPLPTSSRFGFLLVNALWVTTALGGAIPFMGAPTHLSFTDAVFESISALTTTGSTVVSGLDELPPDAQARLVTVLRDAAIARGGAWRPLDMRVVATSRRDLDREVQDGRFREDLLYRLAGARIDLPPLRARHGDVELLAEYFWKLHRGDGPLPKSVVLLLARQPLPGNVTELSHVIARRVALGHDAHPRAWMGAPLAARPRETRGPDVIDEIVAQRLSLPAARQRVIDEFERRYLVAALEDHGGNVTRAAATSGLTRRHFHSLLAKSRSSSRPPPLPEE